VQELRRKKQGGGRREHWRLLPASLVRKVVEVEAGQTAAGVSGAMRTVGFVADPEGNR